MYSVSIMGTKRTFLEFFAGGGMARLGLSDTFDCVFANEIDPKKCRTYRENFGAGELVEGDIAALRAADLPTADLAWASFPCQDLSLAGQRSGMVGARSGTFWRFWDLMMALRQEGRAPRVIVIENVMGLLTSRAGADFATLASAIGAQGYRLGGTLLDAASFVPQSRPRVFLVAWRADETSERPPISETCAAFARALEPMAPEIRQVWSPIRLPAAPKRQVNLQDIIEVNLPESVWRTAEDLEKLLGLMAPIHKERVAAALAEGDPRVGAVFRRVRNGQQRAEVRYDGLAGCLRTLKGGSSRQLLLISQNGTLRLRAMQPREAARLMGLPETYKLPKHATPAISLCGDGVCVPAVAWLSRHVLASLLHLHAKTEPCAGIIHHHQV